MRPPSLPQLSQALLTGSTSAPPQSGSQQRQSNGLGGSAGEGSFIPGLNMPLTSSVPATPAQQQQQYSLNYDPGSLEVLLGSLKTMPALRTVTMERLATVIVKHGAKIADEERRDIMSVLRDRVLFYDQVWTWKILQWSLGILKAITPQMRNFGGMSNLIDKCLTEPFGREMVDLVVDILVREDAKQSTQALEYFIHETVKIPFRDEQLEWVACHVGVAQQDLMAKGIFRHLTKFLSANVNPFFAPLAPEGPCRADSSLTVVMDFIVSKKGPLLVSTYTKLLGPYIRLAGSLERPPTPAEVEEVESVLYSLSTLCFACPAFVSASLEGFFRFLQGCDLSGLIAAERKYRISSFQTFDEGFDTLSEKKSVGPSLLSWANAFLALNTSLVTRHGFALFVYFQDLAFQCHKGDTALFREILDLAVLVFSKIQEQVLLKDRGALDSFDGHTISICSATIRMLEQSDSVVPHPALPSVLLLELLGTSGSTDTARVILSYLLLHSSAAGTASLKLFAQLGSFYSKVHTEVVLQALVAGIQKLPFLSDPKTSAGVMQAIEVHLRHTGTQSSRRAILTLWKSLFGVWKMAAEKLQSPPSTPGDDLYTSLQSTILSILSLCSTELAILQTQVFDFLDSLVGAVFDLLSQRLVVINSTTIFVSSRLLTTARSIIVKLFEAVKELDGITKDGLISYYFDILLQGALKAASLKPLAPQPLDVDMTDASEAPQPFISAVNGSAAVAPSSILGRNRERELPSVQRKVTNSIQKKNLVHTGRLKARVRTLKGADSTKPHLLPSPFHDMGTTAPRNDLVVQNVADLLQFFAILLQVPEGSKSRPVNTPIVIERIKAQLWPAISFAPLANYDKILPNKPTFEKDILVKALFDENLILWELVMLVGDDAAAFCELERPVESLLAATIGFWNSQSTQNSRIFGKQLDQSCRLMELFRKVQFVPPIFSLYGEIFEKIRCKDISQVLMNVWNFIRNNPPKPEHYDKNGKRKVEEIAVEDYLDNVKAVLRNNVVNLGETYSRFFHH